MVDSATEHNVQVIKTTRNSLPLVLSWYDIVCAHEYNIMRVRYWSVGTRSIHNIIVSALTLQAHQVTRQTCIRLLCTRALSRRVVAGRGCQASDALARAHRGWAGPGERGGGPAGYGRRNPTRSCDLGCRKAADRRRWRAGVDDEMAGGRTTSVVLSRESDGGRRFIKI
jgi:hypothetical protein